MSMPTNHPIFKLIEKKEAELKKLGADTEWHIKAFNKAEKEGNDNALIHALAR